MISQSGLFQPAPTCERELTGNKGPVCLRSENPAEAGTADAMRRAFWPRSAAPRISQGGSDAHSGLGDFGDWDDLNRAGGGPDVRSGLSGVPACVRPEQL